MRGQESKRKVQAAYKGLLDEYERFERDYSDRLASQANSSEEIKQRKFLGSEAKYIVERYIKTGVDDNPLVCNVLLYVEQELIAFIKSGTQYVKDGKDATLQDMAERCMTLANKTSQAGHDFMLERLALGLGFIAFGSLVIWGLVAMQPAFAVVIASAMSVSLLLGILVLMSYLASWLIPAIALSTGVSGGLVTGFMENSNMQHLSRHTSMEAGFFKNDNNIEQNQAPIDDTHLTDNRTSP